MDYSKGRFLMKEKRNRLLETFDYDVKSYSIQEKPKKMRKQKAIYADQLICLAALVIMSVWKSGARAGVICAVSVIVCMLADMLFCYLSKKTYNPKDLSTIASGLCLALMMPASIEYGLVILGSAMAMGIKHIFGGKDNYIFNPTCVSIAFLTICYPEAMLLYPRVDVQPPVFDAIPQSSLVSGIESYLMKTGTAQSVSPLDVLLGNFVGALGTVHVLVLIVCGICLMCRHSMSILVTLSGLVSFVLLTALFPVYSDIASTLVLEFIGGYLLFGVIFLVSDPQTLPKSVSGKIVYGVLLGILAVLFRHFGKVENSFIFALLIANVLSLGIDGICAAVIGAVRSWLSYLTENMGRYERLSEAAKAGETPRLSDTQEIIVPAENYNMPPIDNKVRKINRKKGNLIANAVAKLVPQRKKPENRGAYLEQLRENKKLKSGSKPQKTPETHSAAAPAAKTAIKQPKKNTDNKKGKSKKK